jgi:hypothetical protein
MQGSFQWYNIHTKSRQNRPTGNTENKPFSSTNMGSMIEKHSKVVQNSVKTLETSSLGHPMCPVKITLLSQHGKQHSINKNADASGRAV